jgi:hypothetical protein
MNQWLERFGAKPFNYNMDIEEEDLSGDNLPEFHLIRGTNFFRGLALIDLAQAMLKRAFGEDGVAVRVNAAGQGDYFQVHIDKNKADPEEVKEFLREAFYHRFSLSPEKDFVEVHSGGGAVGLRLSRFDNVLQLAQSLESVIKRRKVVIEKASL